MLNTTLTEYKSNYNLFLQLGFAIIVPVLSFKYSGGDKRGKMSTYTRKRDCWQAVLYKS